MQNVRYVKLSRQVSINNNQWFLLLPTPWHPSTKWHNLIKATSHHSFYSSIKQWRPLSANVVQSTSISISGYDFALSLNVLCKPFFMSSKSHGHCVWPKTLWLKVFVTENITARKRFLRCRYWSSWGASFWVCLFLTCLMSACNVASS